MMKILSVLARILLQWGSPTDECHRMNAHSIKLLYGLVIAATFIRLKCTGKNSNSTTVDAPNGGREKVSVCKAKKRLQGKL
jgi:hypothetical protein